MRKKRVVLHVLKYEKNAAKEGKTLLKLNYEKKKSVVHVRQNRTCTTAVRI